MTAQLKPAVTIDAVYSPVIERLSGVLNGISRRSADPKDLHRVISLLGSLPLPTNVYGLYRNRLESACEYLGSGEFGAALWEARTVLNQLRSSSEQKTIEPRRRKSVGV